jgi:hypothetical protein
MLKMIRKIISGGQTGADRAGLDFAIEAGLEHGGYVPRGRKAEDGRIDRYNLIELSTSSYPARTRRNIEKSDGTVIFSRGNTREAAMRPNKPHSPPKNSNWKEMIVNVAQKTDALALDSSSVFPWDLLSL